MGKLDNGITGNCRGRIGNLVFYTLNGKNVSRTIGKSNKPTTGAQLQNRKEMAVVIDFLKPILEFINAGFSIKASGTTKIAHNMAVSYNKKSAVVGSYPNVELNYGQILVTEGDLPGALSPQVELITEGLKFNWSCPEDLPWPRETDQVMLLAYFPSLKKAVYVLAGVSRSLCETVLKLQSELLTAYIEVYISFVAQNRKNVADSSYLGSLNY